MHERERGQRGETDGQTDGHLDTKTETECQGQEAPTTVVLVTAIVTEGVSITAFRLWAALGVTVSTDEHLSAATVLLCNTVIGDLDVQ